MDFAQNDSGHIILNFCIDTLLFTINDSALVCISI